MSLEMPFESWNKTPFSEWVALHNDTGDIEHPPSHVPGEPQIPLQPRAVHEFLTRELATPMLDGLFPKLWLVARRSGHHLDVLHVHKIKGRSILPAENPDLHLVTHDDEVYLKPIPLCILNHSFWSCFLCAPSQRWQGDESNHATTAPIHESQSESNSETMKTRAAALGLLRSYAHLILHRSDLAIAKQHGLIPVDCDWLTWTKFISAFRCVPDEQVTLRYHYGQLRMRRLNWAVRIFGLQNSPSRFFYQIPYWSISVYVKTMTAPFFFVFASLSLVLSAMQVALSVPLDQQGTVPANPRTLQVIWYACWESSLLVMIVFAVFWLLLLLIPASVLVWQANWALRHSKQ